MQAARGRVGLERALQRIGVQADAETVAVQLLDHAAPASYHRCDRLTRYTTESITGTSTSTPTTVASAAPESKPNSVIAAATASSKKLLAPMRAEGPATAWATRRRRLSQ